MNATIRLVDDGGDDDFEWRPTGLPNIELAVLDGQVFVRDPAYPVQMLAFTFAEWEAFVAGVKDGEFDDLARRPE